MQFFWKYVDDLMGKGISGTVILELLFYISASLIPLALPLAILLSSIMTLGNLSEHNELTALKSSGLSLYRILKPLTVIILIIATCTFFFANYVIPVANLKWHSLIYDIQNTKISSILVPGTYSTQLDGYAIKIDEGGENEFKGIIIHDHTTPTEIKTIRAESGKIYKSSTGKEIFFELKKGNVMEELAPTPPAYDANGNVVQSKNNQRPARRSTFEQATYKIDLSGFDMNNSQEDMFKDKHEMLNVFQISYARDSIETHAKGIIENFTQSFKNDQAYFIAKKYGQKDSLRTNIPMDTKEVSETPKGLVHFNQLSDEIKLAAITKAQTKLRNRNERLEAQKAFVVSMKNDLIMFMIEYHRKFALTFAIIVLFFIGAPLGAIVRKGGFGAPVVIAALLFMVYFVLLTIGENLAMAHTVTPFVGMWFPTLVLTPIALLLMRAAANDRPIFNFDGIKSIFKKK